MDKPFQILKKVILLKKKIILLGLFLVLISRVAALAIPASSKYLVDEVIKNKDYQMLKNLLILIIIATLIQAVTSFLLSYIVGLDSEKYIGELRLKAFKKALSLPIGFFDNIKSGTMVSRIMDDAQEATNIIGIGFIQFVGSIFTATISFIYLLKISSEITLIILLPIILFMLIALKTFKYLRPTFNERAKMHADVKGKITESINGIRTIKGFDAEIQEYTTFKIGIDSIILNRKKSLIFTSYITGISIIILGIVSSAIIGIGGHQIITNVISFGDFLSYTLFLGFMLSPIIQISNIGSQITEAIVSVERINDLMKTKTEVDDEKRISNLSSFQGEINFHNVSFVYNETPVIENISFNMPAGSVTALVGSSGSGKTTIAELLSSFIAPTVGKITIDGVDLSTIVLSDYRKNLGYITQEDFLFEGSIIENILLSNPKSTDSDLSAAVKAAYVDEFTDKFTDKLNTIVGERGVRLSGGQRQRIVIARAILGNPKIFILDEATSNLDSESEIFIQKSLEKLIKNRTTLIIAHRLSTIIKADNILVIEDGNIIESGTHHQLLKLKGRYYNLYKYQTKI